MIDGTVTEFAKKKFEQGDKNVAQYLAQIKAQVNEGIQHKTEQKANVTQKVAVDAKNLVNATQAVSIKLYFNITI